MISIYRFLQKKKNYKKISAWEYYVFVQAAESDKTFSLEHELDRRKIQYYIMRREKYNAYIYRKIVLRIKLLAT